VLKNRSSNMTNMMMPECVVDGWHNEGVAVLEG
jgi:hypothetical protein